ncbi:beta family protein [Aeromonas jandaei]|uniref:beta family protein n=1 Tax=Aeromonas jandaei TaxID=650 RepID=UPI003EC7AD69
MKIYIPCLKAKRSEVLSLDDLDENIQSFALPLFDIPRDAKNQTEISIKNKIETFTEQLERSSFFTSATPFYIDNNDLDESIDIDGIEQYKFLLDSLIDFNPIPVIGLDRTTTRLTSIVEFVNIKKCKTTAIRLKLEDIASYKLIRNDLNIIKARFINTSITRHHLIIDLGYIAQDAYQNVNEIIRFIDNINQDWSFECIAIVGSSIPANISSLANTYSEEIFERKEQGIWEKVRVHYLNTHTRISYGDYTVVSPETSDVEIPPQLMRLVSTPKVFYSYRNQGICFRGGSFQTDSKGNNQYFDIADSLCSKSYFRQAPFSAGDKYAFERSHLSSKRPAKAGSPSSWIRAMVNAHMTYIIKSII